jgi:hypothetical protein
MDKDCDRNHELELEELDHISGGLPSLGDAISWAAHKLGLGGAYDTVVGAIEGVGSFLGSIEVRGGRGPQRPL